MSHRPGFDQTVLDLIPNNSRLLEVGPGLGLWAWLIKAYKTEVKVTGVEPWEPYIFRLKQMGLHDHLIPGDVRHLRLHPGAYDVALWSDGPEHLVKGESLAVIKYLESWARRVILTTPSGYMKNPGVNKYDVHLSAWTAGELEALGYEVETMDCLAPQLPRLMRPLIRSYQIMRGRPQDQLVAFK